MKDPVRQTPSSVFQEGTFLDLVRRAFAFPPENLSHATVLRDLDGWDSLTSVMLVAEIYADYGVQVSGEELEGCRTPGDLKSLVQEKL